MHKYIYKVLVAEDEPIILQDTIQEIEDTDLGFVVKWTANNGKDALDLIKLEKPDVIFTDIRMPIMSGMELINDIRKMYTDIPIVLLTGFLEFDYAKQAIQFDVEDYLLKPLESDELRTVLSKIRSKLEREKESKERNILYSKVHGIAENQPMPFQYEQDIFELYLIQIGNLYYYNFSELVLETIRSAWKLSAWEEWMQTLYKDGVYWVIDEKKANQKFLLIENRRERSFSEKMQFAERLREKFAENLQGLPIHIIMADAGIHYQDIWNNSENLRNITENTKIVNEILVCNQEKQKEMVKIPSALQKELQIDLNVGNLAGIEQNVGKYLTYLTDTQMHSFSQRQIEMGILHIYADMMGSEYSAEKEKSMLSRLRYDHFYSDKVQIDYIWKLLEDEYLKLGKNSNMTFSIKEIENYIQKHYAENITIAQLSKIFHFNGNYLTKVFKKSTGDSPMAYLIQTRLNRALDLMRTREDLDIQEISQMVGYEDAHYFSRIFKNKLGKSPSDYRKEIEDNEKDFMHQGPF